MNTPLQSSFTSILEDIIKRYTESKTDRIFVLVGITPYVDIDAFAGHITDVSTFNKDGNAELFSKKEWFVKVYNTLINAQGFQIMSHQQFSYICSYLSEGIFEDRPVIIYDNLRSIFPILKEDYIERGNDESDEERPEGLPIYQAEQIEIGNKYYYSLINFSASYATEEFFCEEDELKTVAPSSGFEVLDVISNQYAIDEFVNHCIEGNAFNKQILVKAPKKDLFNQSTLSRLKKLNHLLGILGGGVYEQKEEAINKDYTPEPHTVELLRQYWGEKASFRNILFYENPGISNNIVPISQGLLVDTIIKEYENGRNGISPRDIFITAPTGAGKSLIFQLPAIYAANKGDVTIVVTPLIELMNDQVQSLKQKKYSRVELVNSNLSFIDRGKIIKGCQDGDIDILYLSPELLLSYDIRYFLGERKLGLLVVDEAHLITTWGRDFRVDYWFLGNHINKIRKSGNYMFPLVALTATAVFGGINDMVFDSISSLNMYDPYIFIGNVKRNDIEFVIDTHDDYKSNYDTKKEDETIDFIQGIHDLDLKGIIYAPYRRHVDSLKRKLDEKDPTIAVAFHADLLQDEKKKASFAFRNNECKTMIATKAFGMGVDIPDIQVVYHHAPSGLLPDYVQEIGRVARDESIQGFAALTFSHADLRYSKQLFGMSSLKTFQLQEVLRKIYRSFKMNGRKRNMLVSAHDFAYIFNTNDELEQKVSTALMMIEKDYLEKTRFNVLIARPKKLFTKVYARIDEIGIDRLRKLYGDCFEEIHILGNYHVIRLDLDHIWSKHFSDKSFPELKKEFYNQYFLHNQGIKLEPQIKISILIEKPFHVINGELTNVLSAIKAIFTMFKGRGRVFTQEDFVEELANRLNKTYNIEKLADFILATYSGRMTSSNNKLEGDSFLQQRTQGNIIQYRVYSPNYGAKLSQLSQIFSKLFENTGKQAAERFLSINDIPLKNCIRIGSLLDIMALGTFETAGGEEPKIFLRINDPYRIERDSKSQFYKNSILENVKRRHEVSCDLFKHFFTNYFSKEKRWNLIEDFFLGMSNDEIFEKYPGTEINHVNIIEYLKTNARIAKPAVDSANADSPSYSALFIPIAKKFYFRDNYITIGHTTMAVKEWLTQDPISLHRTIREYDIRIEKEDYKVLMNKLSINYFPYYRDYKGLDLLIEFSGYPQKVKASVPYKEKCVEFYRWWKNNQDKIKLTPAEKIKLFLAVYDEKPKVLLKEHRKIIRKK